jgi:hypothetical protein
MMKLTLRHLTVVVFCALTRLVQGAENLWYETAETVTVPVSSGTTVSVYETFTPLWTADVSKADALEARGRTVCFSDVSALDTTPFIGLIMIFK